MSGSQGKASLPLCTVIKSLPSQFGNRLRVPSTDSRIAQYSAGSLCGTSQPPPPHPPSLVPLLMPQGGVRGSGKHVPRAGVSTPRAAGSPMAQQSCRRGWSAFGLTTHQTFSHKKRLGSGVRLRGRDGAKHYCQSARTDYPVRLYCTHIRSICVRAAIQAYIMLLLTIKDVTASLVNLVQVIKSCRFVVGT